MKLSSLHVIIPMIISISAACTGVRDTVPRHEEEKGVKELMYRNPVFEPILADPTVVRDPSTGYFYAYGTQDDWGDGHGSRLVPVLRSSDLAKWTVVGNAFVTKPDWKSQGGIWAPDVVEADGNFLMYYAYSIWDDPNPGIGVAISSRPQGPFIDKGKLFDSEEVGVPNSIDPFYWDEDGEKYLFWGSYSNANTQGTYGIPLSDDGLRVPDLSKKFKIAAGDFEAVIIHKRNNYYYFIGSKGHCCDGVKSTYHMLVARSTSIKGPYVDKEGRDITQRGHGSVLVKGNDEFVGPGHGSRILSDSKGKDWILYHGIDVKQGNVSSGATRRVLLLDEIVWKNDWPEIAGQTPGNTNTNTPNFQK